MLIRKKIGTLLLAFTGVTAWGQGPGTAPGNWRERGVLTLTNTVRMHPGEYRDNHLTAPNILLPASYPPVNPVYWDARLSASSQDHSLDMAENCGMQHSSCDGTTANARITSYYPGGGWWGENIATGQDDAMAVMATWLLDLIPDPNNPGSSIPAADESGSDGHRSNIMNDNFREMGAGYAYNGNRQWYDFWTQDFGGQTEDAYPIPSGAHFFEATGQIRFMVNYFDPDPAIAVTLILDNQLSPMSLLYGTYSAGTYAITLAAPPNCSEYLFRVTNSSGTVTYPASGTLTVDDGNCAVGTLSLSELRHEGIKAFTSHKSVRILFQNTWIGKQVTLEARSLKGQLLYAGNSQGKSELFLHLSLFRGISGVVFINAQFKQKAHTVGIFIPVNG